MTAVNIQFRVKLKSAFLDRAAARQIDPVMRRFFSYAGNNVRREARRSLKLKRKTLGEMTEAERDDYRRRQKAFRDGRSKIKPQRPNATAKPGDPPRMQFLPNPLRDEGTGILFTLTEENDSVVVGPSPFKDNNAEAIERKFPFMEPALEKVRPTLPSLLQRAAR